MKFSESDSPTHIEKSFLFLFCRFFRTTFTATHTTDFSENTLGFAASCEVANFRKLSKYQSIKKSNNNFPRTLQTLLAMVTAGQCTIIRLLDVIGTKYGTIT